jgi:catechol 2,3-dioxygenase
MTIDESGSASGSTEAEMQSSMAAVAAGEHPISPQEIGHVVLRVRDLARSIPFYELLGFTKVGELPGMMAFFSTTGSNHHDLALQQVGPNAPQPSPFAVGLYHIAIRVPSDDHVRAAFRALAEAGVELVGTADHAVSHSLYLKDPDGIEIEIYADVPGWRELEDKLVTRSWDPRS